MDLNDSSLDICRLCLDKVGCLLPLFSKIKNIFLRDILKVTIDINVAPTDNLPRKICSDCLTKIDYIYNIREEFKLNERKLENILNSGSLTNYCKSKILKESKEVRKETYAESIMRQSKNVLLTKKAPVFGTKMENVKSVGTNTENTSSNEKPPEMEPPDAVAPEESNEDESQEPKEEMNSLTTVLEVSKSVKEFVQIPPHFCYVCDANFKTAETLEDHMVTHFSMLPYTCEKCSTVDIPSNMKTLMALNKHFQMHTNPIKCLYCERRFNSISARMKHERRYHMPNYAKQQCSVCHKSYANENYLQNHTKLHNGVGKFKCGFCKKQFINNATLQRHERIHSDEKPFVCHICGRSFSHETNFQDHKNRHLEVVGFKCTYCVFSFENKEDLHEHTRIHFNKEKFRIARRNSDTKIYKCTVCDYVSSTYGGMHSHKLKHTKIHQCVHCGKKFGKFQMLQDHENIHTGARPYQCTTCGKSFAQAANFYVHVRIHTGVKKYKCDFCDKRFLQAQNCKVHMRLHTRESMISCKFCPKKFAEKYTMKNHIKTQHSDPEMGTEIVEPEADIVYFQESPESMI